MKTATKIAVVPKQHYRSFMSIISNMSILELKQMLARVNQDINSIKRTERRNNKAAINNAISELAECNKIAATFTGKQYNKPVQNAKIIADIQIQKDILEFINNGGMIKSRVSRKKIKPLTVSTKIISL
jgi:hypothetical protein